MQDVSVIDKEVLIFSDPLLSFWKSNVNSYYVSDI